MSEKISRIEKNRITFRVDKNNWICVYDFFKKVMIRCSEFGRIRVARYGER